MNLHDIKEPEEKDVFAEFDLADLLKRYYDVSPWPPDPTRDQRIFFNAPPTWTMAAPPRIDVGRVFDRALRNTVDGVFFDTEVT